MTASHGMRIQSVQVGDIQTVQWRGTPVETAIFKTGTSKPVTLDAEGISSDRQADRKAHGGLNKAVYSYDLANYEYWRQTRPGEYPAGIFGENLTTEGLDEATVRIGDRFRVGSVVLEACQPRIPCFKLGIRFNDASMIKAFLAADRPGIYFRVSEPGSLQAGDEITLAEQHPQDVRIYEIYQAFRGTLPAARLQALLEHPLLLPAWRDRLLADSGH